MSNTLTFLSLRAANEARMPMFKNAKGEVAHSGTDWSRSDWMVATLGELGETANLMKKIRREDFSDADVKDKLSQEFADVVIYLDMLAAACEVSHMVLPRFRSFADIREERNGLTLPAWPVRYKTQNDRMVAGFRHLGIAAGLLDDVTSGLREFRTIRFSLAQHLGYVLIWIDRMAEGYGIDLGQAITDTFNAKSAQLELPLYIGAGGVATPEPPPVWPEVTYTIEDEIDERFLP